MGGNALSKPSPRLRATEYRSFADGVLRDLRAVFRNDRMVELPSYFGKPDFGDMDVLIASGGDYAPGLARLALCATEMVRNGDVTSFGVPLLPMAHAFQVDLISVPPKSFGFAAGYFSFNDLGNLLGRVAHKAGFKLGHLGLLYVVREMDNADHVLAEIPVTRDWNQALRLLGYDPAAYAVGATHSFRTLDDVFRYAVSSPHINRDIFLLENRNNKARVRDRKRKTYMAFLDWLEQQPPNAVPAFDWSDKRARREDFLALAKTECPDFAHSLASVLQDAELARAAHARFNADIVAKLTGLQGPALGAVMRAVQARFASKIDLYRAILAMPQVSVEAMVRQAAAEVPA